MSRLVELETKLETEQQVRQTEVNGLNGEVQRLRLNLADQVLKNRDLMATKVQLDSEITTY